MHADHGNIFEELPHSLEVVSFNKGNEAPPATPREVTKVLDRPPDESADKVPSLQPLLRS